MSVLPVFAVVGHPNKGKSSLVAALAEDERVRIAPEPGTTTRANHYPMRLDGETLYELVDTPGFQRARKVLAWLEAEAERRSASAAERAEIVARFCKVPEHRSEFPDEVELLAPIVAGAGILYVVDGSVPYGSEYEAEMEILRWTGRPSLAVINPIGSAQHVPAWQAALGQYFKVVRVLDAVQADFGKRLELLGAFGELEEAWRAPLRRAVEGLEADRSQRVERAAALVAQMLTDAATLKVEKRIAPGEDPEAASLRAELEERYRSELRRLERRCRREVESVHGFRDLDVHEPDVEGQAERALLEEDLFARDTWLVFGLRQRDLLAAGAAAGAATGGTLDVALGGTSFLAGAAVGSVVGGVLGWLGGRRLAGLEVLRQPLGGTLLRFGPTRSPNLAFVLLGRARLHHRVVSERTHARRDRVELPGNTGALAPILPVPDGSATRRLIKALSASEGVASEPLRKEVAELLVSASTRSEP